MGILQGLIGGGIKGIADSAKGIIQAVVDGKMNKSEALLEIDKETNRHQESMMQAAIEQEKNALLDVADARNANVKIQESLEASWLSKNAAYIFDFIILISFIAMLTMIVSKTVPESNKEIFYMGFGLLGSYAGQTMGFHRGSSKGSEDKQRLINRMSK